MSALQKAKTRQSEPSEFGPDSTAIPISRKRQVQSNFFWTWSLKAGGRLVGLESELEFRAWHYLSAQPDVVQIGEQPVRIPHLFSAGHRYTFDTGVRRSDGTETLYEVKPESQLGLGNDGTLAPKYWDEISNWCRAEGRNCGFITDRELEPHTLLIDNWIKLMPYIREAHEYPEPDVQAELIQLAGQPGGIELRDAAARIGNFSTQTVTAQAMWLLHEREISADLDTENLDGELLIRNGDIGE